MNSRLRHLLWLPPAFAVAFLLVVGWPGGVSVDMLTSIEEGRYFRFWGHQEPMCGLLWAGIQAALPDGLLAPATEGQVAVTDVQVAVVGFFVVQTLLYWLAFLLLAREALRAGSVVAALLAVASGFLPPLLCFTVMVESNIQSGIAWVGALAIAASLRSRFAVPAWVGLLWFGFLVRSGMIVPLVPVAFACTALAWPQWRKWRVLGVSIGIAIAFQGISFTVTKTLLGAPTRDSVLSVSQVFDMAAVYHETGVHHIPSFMVAEGHTAEEVFAHYQPESVSNMFWRGESKPVFRLPKNPEEGAQVRAAWLQTIREFPGAWCSIKLRYAGILLGLGVEWPGGFWPDYGANERLGLGKLDVPKSPIGVYATKTATSLVWKGWFWILLAGGVVLAGALRRSARTAPAVALYLGGVFSLVPHFLFGQAALCRYYFLPFSLLVSSILVVLPGLLTRRRPEPSRGDGKVPAEGAAA